MVTAVAGCGGRAPDAATPRAAFELVKAAVVDKRFEEMWEMLSAAGREQMNTDAAAIAEKARTASKAEGPGRVALEMELRATTCPWRTQRTWTGRSSSSRS